MEGPKGKALAPDSERKQNGRPMKSQYLASTDVYFKDACGNAHEISAMTKADKLIPQENGCNGTQLVGGKGNNKTHKTVDLLPFVTHGVGKVQNCKTCPKASSTEELPKTGTQQLMRRYQKSQKY
eukprot:5883754-Amphidinium_carterae.1